MKKSSGQITTAAMIAASYVVLCLIFEPISYGPIQVRPAEALTVLPVFTEAAIPGLAIGCLIANMIGGAGIADVVLGTVATLLGAIGTALLKKHRFLAPLPPIIANALIVPQILRLAGSTATSVLIMMMWVGFGELVSCGFAGTALMCVLRRYAGRLFGSDIPEERNDRDGQE